MNTHKIIAWITGILTLSLAIFSFILSFNALTDLAWQHGISIPPLFPFVVEFAVVIFSLNALYRSLVGEPARWQWVLIILSSLLAGVFNVAHAQTDLLSRLIAAMPSLFLLLSFESFLSLLKYNVQRGTVLTNLADLTTQCHARQDELNKLDVQIGGRIDQAEQLHDNINRLTNQLRELEKRTKQAMVVTDAPIVTDTPASVQDNMALLDRANQTRTANVAERRANVLSLLQQGVSPFDISTELDVSLRTIKRDIVALNGQVKQP